MKPFSIGVTVSAGLLVSLLCLPSVGVAAERPSNPAQLLLWFIGVGNAREQPERQKIDVNSASAEALTAVPGLDRRQALQIIAHRPYATLQDLARAGLSSRFIERLTGLLTVDSKLVGHASQPSAAPAAATKAAGPTR